MGLTVITPATATIVTLAEAKLILRVLDASFDDLLTAHIAAAQAQVEGVMGRCLAPQTWRLTLDAFSDAIRLPKSPVTSVTVRYYDLAGSLRTADPALYTLDLVSDPQWIVLNADESWPDTLDAVNAVQIDFDAGFPDLTSNAAIAARNAIIAMVGCWFEDGAIGTIPPGARTILFPYTDHGF